jgi:hypothetical protein
MDLTFSALENKLLLFIAEKPRSIKFLYRKFVEAQACSKTGFYKAIRNLEQKQVIRTSKEARMVCITSKWASEGKKFFNNLRGF